MRLRVHLPLQRRAGVPLFDLRRRNIWTAVSASSRAPSPPPRRQQSVLERQSQRRTPIPFCLHEAAFTLVHTWHVYGVAVASGLISRRRVFAAT